MEKINSLIDFFKSITILEILDFFVAILIVFIFLILSKPFSYIIVKMFNIKIKDKKRIKKLAFFRPLKVFFVLLGIYIGLAVIKLPDKFFEVATQAFKLSTIALISCGFANLFSSDSEVYKRIKSKFSYRQNNTVVNFATKLIKVFIYIIAGFIIISDLGYDLGGLITGLGLSSVVIALAAQDIAKNILGGLSIIADKSFEIGDYIETADFIGTVEDISFRTTKIRDVHNQIIVVPNGKLVDSYVINCSKRFKRRFETTLTVEYGTPLSKVEELVSSFRKVLSLNEHIIQDNVNVSFDALSNDGINIFIFFYSDIVNYLDFLKFKEEINYTLLDIISTQKITLAYPSQSVYIKKD